MAYAMRTRAQVHRARMRGATRFQAAYRGFRSRNRGRPGPRAGGGGGGGGGPVFGPRPNVRRRGASRGAFRGKRKSRDTFRDRVLAVSKTMMPLKMELDKTFASVALNGYVHGLIDGATRLGAYAPTYANLSSGILPLDGWGEWIQSMAASENGVDIHQLRVSLRLKGPTGSVNPARRVRVVMGVLHGVDGGALSGNGSEVYATRTLLFDKDDPALFYRPFGASGMAFKAVADAGKLEKYPGRGAVGRKCELYVDDTFTVGWSGPASTVTVAASTFKSPGELGETEGLINKVYLLKFKKPVHMQYGSTPPGIGTTSDLWEYVRGSIPFFHLIDLSGTDPGVAGSAVDVDYTLQTEVKWREL